MLPISNNSISFGNWCPYKCNNIYYKALFFFTITMKKILTFTFSYFFLQPITMQNLQAMNHFCNEAHKEISREKEYDNNYKDTRETLEISAKNKKYSLCQMIRYLLTIGVPASVIIALLIKY